MNMTEIIVSTILQLLESQGGCALIQRNELAQSIGCVPSQINYVITSRFTPEKGYIVESRRGGGGYIKIEKITPGGNKEPIMHLINSIGDELDELSARIILENLLYDNLLEKKTAKIIMSAINDNTLKLLNPEARDILRARILKSTLISTI